MDKSKLANILPRLAAYLIDIFLVGLVGGVITFILSLVLMTTLGSESGSTIASVLGQLVTAVMAIGYYIYFLTKDGATPGLRYLGLRIVKEDGSILTAGQVFVRMLVFGLLGIINSIVILVSEKRQGVHDMAVGTVCEKVDEQESRAKWVVGISCGCGCLMFIVYLLFAAAIVAAISSGSVTPSEFGM